MRHLGALVPAASATASAAPAPAPACYRGRLSLHDGDLRSIALRRTLDPAHATIVNEWIIDGTANREVCHVKGSRFEMTDDGGGSGGGSGELVGKPWAWTSWTTRRVSPIPESLIIVHTVKLIHEVVHGQTRATTKRGERVPEAETSETLLPIDCADF